MLLLSIHYLFRVGSYFTRLRILEESEHNGVVVGKVITTASLQVISSTHIASNLSHIENVNSFLRSRNMNRKSIGSFPVSFLSSMATKSEPRDEE